MREIIKKTMIKRKDNEKKALIEKKKTLKLKTI
jgi:hypothetical protein